ncbi:MAG: hypothetical protein V2A67_09085 [Bacteroidota bacterium]
MTKKVNAIVAMLTVLIIALGNVVQAQDSTRVSPFHLSFVTPFGTNGLESWNTTNLVSVNILAGFSGGLKGVEVAGFANALKEDMNGIQIAGFCNNTIGKANGLEIAGFWNFNRLKVVGVQAAGFTNVALDTVYGIQASGFVNVALDTVSGFQGSGFANYAHGVSFGQASGFVNVSTGDVSGVQGAGFANITTGDTRGVQAAGFTNITTGTHTGVQASGFFNYARKLRGVQVGIVNVADTVEKGIPIGIFSYVRNGYKVIQIGGNETLFGEISLKTGTTRFYNIFSVGAAAWKSSLKWGWGYGIGTLIPLARRMDLSLEGISYHINEDSWFTDYLNLLNRINLSVSYNLTGRITPYAGISCNIRVSNYGSHEGWQVGNTMVSMYPGFMAGLRIGI